MALITDAAGQALGTAMAVVVFALLAGMAFCRP